MYKSSYLLTYLLTNSVLRIFTDFFMYVWKIFYTLVIFCYHYYHYHYSLSCSIHFYTRALRHIRPALMESMAANLGASLVQSRLDYANSIMYGMSASNMHKLQSAPNSLTRVVLPSLRHLSASERLSYLHWLQFTIATQTYKTLATCQPSYLYNLLQVYHPS